MLKSSIDRERQDLNLLEQRIEEHKRRQTLLCEEMTKIDEVMNGKGY